MTSSLLKPLASAMLATLLTAGLATGGTRVALADLDGDGVANINDPDVDGDGIPNGKDRNVDGGVCRSGPFKGLYVGDRFPNDSPLELDIDGDGRNDAAANENDIDGDGIKNHLDKDRDGDGKKDAIDKDDDGDGVPDKVEPRSARDSLKIIGSRPDGKNRLKNAGEEKTIVGSREGVKPPAKQVSPEVGTGDMMEVIEGPYIDSSLGGSGSLGGVIEIEESEILGPGSSVGLEESIQELVSVTDQGVSSMVAILSSYSRLDPQAASEWLLGMINRMDDRELPEGWFERVLENTSWESQERLDFLEATRDGRPSRRGGRETPSEVEEGILSANDESPAAE